MAASASVFTGKWAFNKLLILDSFSSILIKNLTTDNAQTLINPSYSTGAHKSDRSSNCIRTEEL